MAASDTKRPASSTPNAVEALNSIFMNKENTAPAQQQDANIITKGNESSTPSTPVDDPKNAAPGILDRRKTQKSNVTRSSSGSSTRGGKRRSVLGPSIPIKVNGVASPIVAATASAISMTNLRSEMKAVDGDVTPGESSVCIANLVGMHVLI